MNDIKMLISKIDELILELKNKPRWIEPDEAARILGFRLTTSKSHRRKLQELRESGRIVNFREGRPMLYNSLEIISLSEEMEVR